MVVETGFKFPRPRSAEDKIYGLLTGPVNGAPRVFHLIVANSGDSVLYWKSASGIDMKILRSDRERRSVRGFGDWVMSEVYLESKLALARIIPIVIEAEHEQEELANIYELRRKAQRFLDRSKDF